MSRFLPLLLLVALLGACTSAPPIDSYCAKGLQESTDVRREVNQVHLPPMPTEPVFYFASGHYAVLMPPARLTELLTSLVKNGTSTSNEMLLKAVQQDIPLMDDTDLRKYSIRQTRFDFSLPNIAAALLHEGKASLIDLWEMDEDKEVAAIVVVNESSSLSKRLHFCDSDGETFLSVTDMIVRETSPNNRAQPTLAQARAADAERYMP